MAKYSVVNTSAFIAQRPVAELMTLIAGVPQLRASYAVRRACIPPVATVQQETALRRAILDVMRRDIGAMSNIRTQIARQIMQENTAHPRAAP